MNKNQSDNAISPYVILCLYSSVSVDGVNKLLKENRAQHSLGGDDHFNHLFLFRIRSFTIHVYITLGKASRALPDKYTRY